MSKLIKGVNDLETICKNTDKAFLLDEWDYDENYPLTPSDVSAHTNKKFFWICKNNNNHKWSASPNNRMNGYGCPFCNNKIPLKGVNDLETLFPDIAKEWDFEKNGKLKPSDCLPNSNKKIWWLCDKGHSYRTAVHHRTSRGDGCCYCSNHKLLEGFNDLKTVRPDLAEEWDLEKNKIKPSKVLYGSNKTYFWKCKECGSSFSVSPGQRITSNRGCPFCSGRYAISGKTDFATNNPELMMEWDFEKNKEYNPHSMTRFTKQLVYWKCSNCGNEWQDSLFNRSNGCGCPKCSKRSRTSFPEQAIYFYVKKFFDDAVNSYKDIFDNGMELDIFIPTLNTGIEYDGPYHKGKHQDIIKYQICKSHGIRLIRVSEIERDNQKELCDVFIKSQYLVKGKSFNKTLYDVCLR